MKVILFLLCILIALTSIFSCNSWHGIEHERITGDNKEQVTHEQPASSINKEAAINIAKNDFVRIAGSLKDFIVVASELKDGWRVAIQLKNMSLNGGGAVYIIDKNSGKILDKEFYQ